MSCVRAKPSIGVHALARLWWLEHRGYCATSHLTAFVLGARATLKAEIATTMLREGSAEDAISACVAAGVACERAKAAEPHVA